MGVESWLGDEYGKLHQQQKMSTYIPDEGTGGRMAPKRRTTWERFLSFIDVRADECWLWRGAKRNGYGMFVIPLAEDSLWKAGRVQPNAHRYMWEQVMGPVTQEMQLDHLCRVRACVNPFHLEVVTSRENTLRGVSHAAVCIRENRCGKGHEFTPENTQLYRGRRKCRICRTIYQKAYRGTCS